MLPDPPVPTSPSPSGPAPQPVRKRRFFTLGRILLLTVVIAFAVSGGIAFGILVTYLGEIPLVSDLKAYKPSLSTKIYDSKGNLITELYSEQRTLVKLESTPLTLQNAVISIEDNNFYQHVGIQFSGIFRSIMVDLMHKGYRQGGSTITQQLARNMFLTRQKTVERKIKEIILALQIERTYSKREILEMYLNQIYFGNGAYGAESASRTYFGKHAQDLTLAESALLAGLPRAPNAYNPYRHPDKSIQRRNLVVSQMLRLGYISPEEAVDAKAQPILLSSVEVSEAPYFIEHVRRQLEERFGSNAIYKGGLRVFTTLDLQIQQLAQDAFNEGLAADEKVIKPNIPTLPGQPPEPLQGALVVIDHATGEVKAMIGGRNFVESKFNRVTQAQRQPGSAFKPFIYTTAVAQGFTESDVILDTPVVFKDDRGNAWKPENFSNKFYGPTSLRTALTHSRNVVTVKLLNKVGINNVIQMAERLGIHSPLKPFLTLALGSSELNLLELVSAFGVFPNRGIRVDPVSITRVEDSSGQLLEESAPLRQEVLDPTTTAIMTNLLENVVNRGTGAVARNMGFKYPAGGKTGTTNDYSDAWFIGFTSDYTAGVWVGLDSHRSLGKGVTGGQFACPIWTKLMLKLYADHASRPFVYPDNVETVSFCSLSGLLPNPACAKFVDSGAFAIGTAPSQHCDIHLDANSVIQKNLNLSPDLIDLQGNTTTGQQPAVTPPPQDDRPQQF